MDLKCTACGDVDGSLMIKFFVWPFVSVDDMS